MNDRHRALHRGHGHNAVRDARYRADFLVRYPKVNVVAHATDQNVDIVGENYDIAIRAHSDPLPDSTLVQRTLTPAPWFLFAGSAYLDANEAPQTPEDLKSCPSLFTMRTGLLPFGGFAIRPRRKTRWSCN
jgi:DNA-binding transcriptional LysR family regulator